MIRWLAGRLIGEKPSAENPRVRHAYGVLCGAVGVALNMLLFAGKLLAGLLTGSIAILADAINNLSDAGSSVVTLIGLRIARQQPDAQHPFGHGRVEYVTALAVSMAILFMGVELLKSSIEKIITPEPVAMDALSAVILVMAVLVKLYMALYNRRIGAVIASPPLKATAIDSLSDAVATTVVLAATLAGHFARVPLDGWCGALVALFILLAGARAARDTISPLLGKPAEPQFIARIEAIVHTKPEIVGMHDLIVHDYGPGRRMISLHAEVPAEGDILKLHDAVDNLEKELQETLGCQTVIHMDPILTDDALTTQTRARVAEVIKGLDVRASIHDFRMVTGPTHTNLIFDVVVPYDTGLTDRDVKQRVDHMVRALDGQFYAVIQVDHN
ncbi:MAG: cation diffusion facilitator family transporter [Oscillospiraceae bacterium]|jgi:cation diffusion facilitator family transporter|nr:cation diffusion facilitator family transporter [Oscillospiraceae bacterium]